MPHIWSRQSPQDMFPWLLNPIVHKAEQHQSNRFTARSIGFALIYEFRNVKVNYHIASRWPMPVGNNSRPTQIHLVCVCVCVGWGSADELETYRRDRY